ncbi:Hypothetical protein OINT_1000329 [Brucella intermedia LMG 3301]|uniref:Uncharacterized protein n=2 Tax=Brucella intermedia TaxID=94625 RepID=U4V4S6_9HYPH|nr:Hypothetical protein OINT_1000329 [Brucella intermedia LMG 3301]ERL99663.1 hypothetical protein Q644_09795 [Brucella intermedia 229E]
MAFPWLRSPDDVAYFRKSAMFHPETIRVFSSEAIACKISGRIK